MANELILAKLVEAVQALVMETNVNVDLSGLDEYVRLDGGLTGEQVVNGTLSANIMLQAGQGIPTSDAPLQAHGDIVMSDGAGGELFAVRSPDGVGYNLLGKHVTIADDGVFSVGPVKSIGVIMVYCRSAHITNRRFIQAIVAYDTVTPYTVFVSGLADRVEVTTGPLYGTTGTDNKFTVSAHTDGKIYFENRINASSNVGFIIFA